MHPLSRYFSECLLCSVFPEPCLELGRVREEEQRGDAGEGEMAAESDSGSGSQVHLEKPRLEGVRAPAWVGKAMDFILKEWVAVPLQSPGQKGP